MTAQKSVDRTASVGSYEGTHQNCQRWQFYGHFSDRPRKTANLGSSTDTFRPHKILEKTHPFKTANAGSSTDTFRTGPSKLPTLAVLRTLFGPTNFGAIKTANLGCCMDTFRTEHKSVHKTASVGSFVSTWNFLKFYNKYAWLKITTCLHFKSF